MDNELDHLRDKHIDTLLDGTIPQDQWKADDYHLLEVTGDRKYIDILQEDDAIKNQPGAWEFFTHRIFDITCIQWEEFRNNGQRIDLDEGYSTIIYYKGWKLEIHADDPYWKLSKLEDNSLEVYENMFIIPSQFTGYPQLINSKKPVGVIYANDDSTYNIVMGNTIDDCVKHQFE